MHRDRNPHYRERAEKLKEIEKEGIEPFPGGYPVKNRIHEILERFEGVRAEELERVGETFEVAGRVIRRSHFGKATFIHIQDETGRIQVYLRKDTMGDDAFRRFLLNDIGDLVRVMGSIMRTKTGELTIHARTCDLLAKSLRPLPEKWHGLKDIETRYRCRYLDLISSQEVREVFRTRFRIMREIREFFHRKGFVEVETPMMHPIPGGAAARPFVTRHNTLDMDLYLRIAPELYLKRLLVGGFERVFEINRNFRNEGVSSQHYPEFTMLEFYLANAGYLHLIPLIEELLLHLAITIHGKPEISFEGSNIDLSPPFRRVSLKGAVSEVLEVDEARLEDEAFLKGALGDRGIEMEGRGGKGRLLYLLFEKVVEPRLRNPTFVLDFPKEVSPLARTRSDSSELVERFELFISGREIANAFSELNDPFEQERRFLLQAEERERGDEEAHPFDEEFLLALEYGMPPAAGCGMGIDRLVMLYTGQKSIRDVILFPQLRAGVQRRGGRGEGRGGKGGEAGGEEGSP